MESFDRCKRIFSLSFSLDYRLGIERRMSRSYHNITPPWEPLCNLGPVVAEQQMCIKENLVLL